MHRKSGSHDESRAQEGPRVSYLLLAALLTPLAGCDPAPITPSVTEIADRYYSHVLETTPEAAVFAGIQLERHDGLSDNRPESRRASEAVENELSSLLQGVDVESLRGTSDWITVAYLTQRLNSAVALRICRTELWNVNQMGGWHIKYPQLAELQPVETKEEREQSLARWTQFADYIDQEVALLQQGIDLGYSAPKSVVRRVIDQVDGTLALGVEESPYHSPAARSDDEDFSAATVALVEQEINPALRRYVDYLKDSYLDRARDELAVTANPDGFECYQASLNSYTTLRRTGQEIFDLGLETVAANRAKVIELGQEAYGLNDFVEILITARADPEDRFTSREELLSFSREVVARAEAAMPNWVGRMPDVPIEVVPFAEYEEGTGMSASYRPGSSDRPGEYRIPLYQPEEQSRGNAEATAFHEAWPGHHLQVAIGQSVDGLHPVTQLIWFSGPGEGWARYAEGLAEEMGLYGTKTGPILRRAWPARGMVVDPGIHLFGWTREEAVGYLKESGRWRAGSEDELVDRIAIIPGQLTAYDSGGLEIIALRIAAQEALGDDFDVREFHDRILENGTIPLPQLRSYVEDWIASQKKRP